MKFKLIILLFSALLTACQSCTKEKPETPPLVQVLEDDNAFQIERAHAFYSPEPAAVLVYKADQPVEIYVNGSRTTCTAPDTVFVGAGDEIRVEHAGFADVRWLKVL